MRTELGIGPGSHSLTLIRPRGPTMAAMAWVRTVAGSGSAPPQFPEWWPPSWRWQRRSKFIAPRAPRDTVGRSTRTRGPSEAMKASAANASRFARTTSWTPAEPFSSPVSTMNLALKPSRPRVSSTARSAAMLMVCCPLLSAVPRP